jgi:small subunit ribosomal protein S12
MATYSQLRRKPRFGSKKTKRDSRISLLSGNPQKKVTVVKMRIVTPRKPNSAKRKIVRVRVRQKNSKNLKYSNKKKEKIISAYIMGENQSLSEYAVILIRGGRTKDLPGLHYKVVSGMLDSKIPTERKKKRSRYCIKKPNA